MSDLFEATHVHRLLQALRDLPVPRWAHHRLLTDPTRRHPVDVAWIRIVGTLDMRIKIDRPDAASIS